MEKYFVAANNRFNFFQFDENGKVDFWFDPEPEEVCESVDIIWYKPNELTLIKHECPWGIGIGHLHNLGRKARKTGTHVFMEAFTRPDGKVEAHLTLNDEKRFIAVGEYEFEAYEKAAKIAWYYA